VIVHRTKTKGKNNVATKSHERMDTAPPRQLHIRNQNNYPPHTYHIRIEKVTLTSYESKRIRRVKYLRLANVVIFYIWRLSLFIK